MGFFRVVGGILLAVLTIGLAGAIYQTGFTAGAAGTAGAATPAIAGPYWGWGWGWGFGGGIFHLLGFIFFLTVAWLFRRARPEPLDRLFRKVQLLSAASFS